MRSQPRRSAPLPVAQTHRSHPGRRAEVRGEGSAAGLGREIAGDRGINGFQKYIMSGTCSRPTSSCPNIRPPAFPRPVLVHLDQPQRPQAGEGGRCPGQVVRASRASDSARSARRRRREHSRVHGHCRCSTSASRPSLSGGNPSGWCKEWSTSAAIAADPTYTSIWRWWSS